MSVGAIILGGRLGSEFIPKLNEGAIVFNTIRLASVNLDESQRYGTRIEKLLLEKFPDEIARVWTRTGPPRSPPTRWVSRFRMCSSRSGPGSAGSGRKTRMN